MTHNAMRHLYNIINVSDWSTRTRLTGLSFPIDTNR